MTSTSTPVILEHLVIDGTRKEWMDQFKFAREHLSRKTFGQALRYMQLVQRSFGSITMSYSRQATRLSLRACVRGYLNMLTLSEGYLLEGML